MRRVISFFPMIVLMVVLLTACSGGHTISTGLGVVTGIGKSVAAQDGLDGTAQVESAVVAVTLDSEGRIVKLSIDEPQTRVVFNSKGSITTGLSAVFQSKLEKGAAYGMEKVSPIGKEWFEQIAAFEAWAIGKTVDEVLGLHTKRIDQAHPQVPDDPELTASVTITVGDYLKAIERAAANAKTATVGKTFKTGLGIVTKIAGSTNATTNADGYAQVDSMIAAVTVDDKGEIITCAIDHAQTKVAITETGELADDLTAAIKTLVEIDDDYKQQVMAYADWVTGKTVKAIKETKPTTISINVDDFITAIEKAVANAK